MITYSIIPKSQLEGALRLDAEYYQSEHLEFNQKLRIISERLKVCALNSLLRSDPKYGTSEKLNYLQTGTPFLRISDLSGEFFEIDQVVYISKDEAKREGRAMVRQNDILVSRTGTLGVAVYIDEDFDGAIFGSYFIRISPAPNLSKYLTIYLNSRLGRIQTERIKSGAIQTNLTIPAIQSYKILLPPQQLIREITETFDSSRRLIKLSKSLYSQAEDLLLEELGLKDFEVEDDLSYTVNLAEIKAAHRADAEYFQPKYDRIFNYIKEPIKKLGEITKFLNHAKQPPYIEDGKVPIITQRHLGQVFLNLEAIADPDTKFTSEEWLKKYSAYKLKQGDVLYYSVGAYIGKTNIVLEDLNATAASFITIIRPKEEIEPVYLTVVLNSIIGRLQSEKWQSATAQQYIYPKDIKSFKISILPKPNQQKIADLVRQSHEARKKAKELLKEAKQKVEELIEK